MNEAEDVKANTVVCEYAWRYRMSHLITFIPILLMLLVLLISIGELRTRLVLLSLIVSFLGLGVVYEYRLRRNPIKIIIEKDEWVFCWICRADERVNTMDIDVSEVEENRLSISIANKRKVTVNSNISNYSCLQRYSKSR